MSLVRLHFALVVFGPDHLRWFLEAGLPSQLSPGNLPALDREGPRPVYHIFTTLAETPAIRACPLFATLAELAEVRFHRVDGLVAAFHRKECTSYVLMNHAYSLAMVPALEDQGGVVAIWPDAIFADGGFRRIQELARGGVRCVAVGGNQAGPAIVASLRERFLDPGTGAVAIPPRDLVALTLAHLGPYWEQFFADSPVFPSRLASHIQWRVGDEGILWRSSFLHPLFFVPTAASCAYLFQGLQDGIDASGFFEALTADVARDVHIVTDSDEFCCTGIDARDQPFRTAPSSLNLAELALGLMPRLQAHTRHFFSQSIRFHRGDLGPAWDAAAAAADQATDAIMDGMELLRRRPALFEGFMGLLQRSPEQTELFPFVARRLEALATRWRQAGKRVAVFGTGPWARAVLTGTDLKRCRIAAVVDSNPALWRTPWLDWRIQGPGELAALAPDVIIVTSMGFQEEMARQVQGLEGVTGELVRLFPADL